MVTPADNPNHTQDTEIRALLSKYRVELNAAAGILSGQYLEEFKTIIAEVANKIGLALTDTGTFVKVDPK